MKEGSIMTKVGIITIIDYNNYGNRLQNYAVQETIKSLGYDPITIINFPTSSNKNIIKRIQNKTLKDIFKLNY